MTAAFLTVAQVAARWGCHVSVVYGEIRAGRLAALEIGTNSKRIARAELDRYESARTTGRKAS